MVHLHLDQRRVRVMAAGRDPIIHRQASRAVPKVDYRAKFIVGKKISQVSPCPFARVRDCRQWLPPAPLHPERAHYVGEAAWLLKVPVAAALKPAPVVGDIGATVERSPEFPFVRPRLDCAGSAWDSYLTTSKFV